MLATLFFMPIRSCLLVELYKCSVSLLIPLSVCTISCGARFVKISPMVWVWQFIPIIPAFWEANGGGWFDARNSRLQWAIITALHSSQDDRARPCLFKKKKKSPPYSIWPLRTLGDIQNNYVYIQVLTVYFSSFHHNQMTKSRNVWTGPCVKKVFERGKMDRWKQKVCRHQGESFSLTEYQTQQHISWREGLLCLGEASTSFS